MKDNAEMVQMFFYLRFRSQLKRTKEQVVSYLEETVSKAVITAGGRITASRRLMIVSFDSDRVGFWLDMLILMETMDKVLNRSKHELSGHALVLSRTSQDSAFAADTVEPKAERLCRSLSSVKVTNHNGIWCSADAMEALGFYCSFDNPVHGYGELTAFKSFREPGPDFFFPNREKIMSKLGQGKEENTLLVGPPFFGKRDGLYHFCAAMMKDFPPLIIRFKSGLPGPGCFADALTPQLRSLFKDLEAPAELLFRERVREPVSPFIVDEVKRFLFLLLSNYWTLVRRKYSRALIILEDPLSADKTTVGIFQDVFESLENKNNFFVFGISSSETENGIRRWGFIFPRILKFPPTDLAVQQNRNLSVELWEVAYTFSLLGRYFPPALLLGLMEEEGINTQVPEKALELLSFLGLIDSVQDPQPRIPDFISSAEKILGPSKKEKIKALVRSRLLDMEIKGRINPSFNLLKMLLKLGGKADDALIIRCLLGDIFFGTFSGIDKALADKHFEAFAGTENVILLAWIYKTQRALSFGEPDEIQEAFDEQPPSYPATVFSGYKARILSSLSSYKLGIGDIDAAGETVKELMYLNQNLKDGSIPSYRLFSLINLFKSRMDEALEYCSYGVELAQKSGQKEELIKASYFGSIVQFQHGNLSAAEELIVKSETIARDLCWLHWEIRARFFRGRLRFEAGRYRDALEIFESLEEFVPAGQGEDTLDSWIFRTKVYYSMTAPREYGRRNTPPEFPDDGNNQNTDAGLFRIEAAFLQGNFEAALKLCENCHPEPDSAEDTFFFTEQPDWNSGFSQCEALFISAKAYRNRLISVYQALSQSRLALSPERADELCTNAQNMIREYLLSEWDINDIFYLYAQYLIFREAGASRSGEGVSALSMAFKRIQRRAACINNKDTRDDYISLNYWNNALYLAAREHKLI